MNQTECDLYKRTVVSIDPAYYNDMISVYLWLQDNVSGSYYGRKGFELEFDNEEDALQFKLAFGI